jgi:hypothetical protein
MTHAEIERGEVVERYVLRRLSAREEAEFEEHYLVCEDCREKVRQDEPLVEMLRSACADWTYAPRRPRRWFLPSPAWGLAAAVGAAAVFVIVALPPAPVRNPATQTAALQLPVVELSAYRAGGDSQQRVNPSEPFLLRLDTRGLTAGPDYALEIVDESGDQVWTHPSVRQEATQAEVRVIRGLAPGLYWVRLSRNGTLAREYQLRAATGS